MEAIFVLFHFRKKGELSYDTRLRMDAAAHIFQRSVRSNKKVIFVGGGGLRPSGAQRMSDYWQKMYHWQLADVQTILLETSNSTYSNVEEIKKFIQEKGIQKITLLTNHYHVDRVRQELQRYNLAATVVSAEDILLKKQERERDVQQYMVSYPYHFNMVKEKLILFVMNKKVMNIIRKWREFRYR